MARILIAYATGHGQTGLVVQRLAAVLSRHGHAPVLADLLHGPLPKVEEFDGALVAAPVHFGKHHKAVLAFCAASREALTGRPSAFISVSLSANRPTVGARREVAKSVAHLLKATAWVPLQICPVAGALLYTKYGPFLRRVMRFFAKMAGRDTDTTRDYEYTDWAAVEAFAREFGARLPATAQPSAA